MPAVVAEDSTWILAVMIVAKFLAYGVSLGCGFRGGPIFPAIFLGVALASLAVVWFDVSPTFAIAVGAAAGMAAQARLLIAPLLFACTASRDRGPRRDPRGRAGRGGGGLAGVQRSWMTPASHAGGDHAAMTPRTEPPFRADHVGSLLRPERLLRAREEHAAGRLDADELRAVEDDAIREAVRLQEDVGLQSATDGEFRRTSWHMDFIYRLGGVAPVTDESIRLEFTNEQGDAGVHDGRAAGARPVRLEDTIFGDDFAFLRDTVTTAGRS